MWNGPVVQLTRQRKQVVKTTTLVVPSPETQNNTFVTSPEPPILW